MGSASPARRPAPEVSSFILGLNLLLQLEPALVAGAHAVALKDLVDGGEAHRNTFQGQVVEQPTAAPSGTHQGQFKNDGVGPVYRGQIFDPFQSAGL